ncbi:uncharacterized protein LOC116269444 isoform X1 [Papio anubis]|uniref:uncharacterized protein LOC116269444 isoform X1 n=1 Tax=Papio anubis TaxID=9555 RepID=UPI0012AE4114|nr:uncharacterized protein LOC116269444 isoform X1 [Papio anubis]
MGYPEGAWAEGAQCSWLQPVPPVSCRCLRKLPGEGSFHCLLNRDRLRKSFKRGPWRVRWPGRCHMQAGGGSGPTSLSLHETMLLDVQDTKIPDTPMDATSNIHKQLGIS